jgi:anti-sigma B factor antagonist
MLNTVSAESHRDAVAAHRSRTTITVTTTAEHATVAISGDIDLAVTTRVRERLEEELWLHPAALVIDLDDVAFCSSGGLSVLLDVVTAAHARGIPCALIAARRAVVRPIRLLRLDRVLPLHSDRTEAEEWLSLLRRLG